MRPPLVHGLLALSLLAACGKRGDPLPPLRKTPLPLANLRIAQRGERIEISGTTPRASVDGVPLSSLEVEVLRAEGEGDLEKVGSRVVLQAAPGASLRTLAPLPAPGTTVRVAARVLSKGRASARSTPVTLKVQPPPPIPTSLAALLGPESVRLSWAGEKPQPVPTPTPVPSPSPSPSPSPPPGPSPSPSAGVSASASPSPSPKPIPTPPPFEGGFWLYRRAKDGEYARPLMPRPVPERSFEDKTAALGAELCYEVRSVASLEPLVESAGSGEICLTVRDVTAPAPPTGLGALFRAGALEVSWSPSSEPDLAAYRLYRSVSGGPSKRIAEISPGETTVLDRDVNPGTDYDYRLTAVDRTGNESALSSPAQGRLP